MVSKKWSCIGKNKAKSKKAVLKQVKEIILFIITVIITIIIIKNQYEKNREIWENFANAFII